jgi:hypothetical protein
VLLVVELEAEDACEEEARLLVLDDREVEVWAVVELELEEVLVLEVVLVGMLDQEKLVVANTTGPYAPQVAFTTYVPSTHEEEPPVTKLSEKRPDVPLTGAWSTVARTLLGL